LSDEESALFGTTYSDIYDNSIHWVDRQMKTLFEALDEAGLSERTIIVLAADHGEEFGEHANEGHAKDLYGEVIQTPLIIRLPFEIESGIVVETASRNVDIWPTLFDLLGVPAPDESDGRSLVPDVAAAVSRSAPRDTGPVFAHLDRTWGRMNVGPRWIIAATDYPHRLIFHPDGSSPNELYDIATDPGEHENRYAADAETAKKLEQSAREYAARTRATWALEKKTVELDDMMMGQLRAIGYAIE
jgi:arylsulfatase A-like enzyme